MNVFTHTLFTKHFTIRQPAKWAVVTAIVSVLMLSGCASTSPVPSKKADATTHLAKPSPFEIKVQAQRKPVLALMTAELAAQRGEFDLAVDYFLALAEAQQDASLAKRAVELAIGEGQLEPALRAAKAWLGFVPEDKQATRTVMVLQLGTNRVDEAMPALKAYLADIERAEGQVPGVSQVTVQRVATEMLMRVPDKALAYKAAVELFGNDPNNADNQLMLAQIADAQGQPALAVMHMGHVLQKAHFEHHVMQQAQFMEKRDGNPKAAIQLLEQAAKAHPKWFNVRLYLARVYTQTENWLESQRWFNELLALQPDNTPLYSSLGFVAAKLGERALAEQQFKTYFTRTPAAERKHEILIHLTLADLAQIDKDFAAAMRWLDEAPGGRQNLDIAVKKYRVLEAQGKLAAAKAVLDGFKPVDPDVAVTWHMTRAQLAVERKALDEAARFLEQGLQVYPEQPELLYERAMVAEKQSNLADVERFLNRLIEIKPNNAHAYNALGYTFADYNVRLPEALKLIRKAHELAPEDPYIMDSLGWVYYRMGDLTLALDYLKRAFDKKPEEEIGTHFVEVLMKANKPQEAKAVIETLRARFPNSQKLGNLLQHFPQLQVLGQH